MSCSFTRWRVAPNLSAMRVRECKLAPFVCTLFRSPGNVVGKVGWKSLCPLGKVLTYNNLIYLLNFPFYCIDTPCLMGKYRINYPVDGGQLNLNRDL